MRDREGHEVMSNRKFIIRLHNAGLVAAVMQLWDEGQNTADIANALMHPEHEVMRALCKGREERRAA